MTMEIDGRYSTASPILGTEVSTMKAGPLGGLGVGHELWAIVEVQAPDNMPENDLDVESNWLDRDMKWKIFNTQCSECGGGFEVCHMREEIYCGDCGIVAEDERAKRRVEMEPGKTLSLTYHETLLRTHYSEQEILEERDKVAEALEDARIEWKAMDDSGVKPPRQKSPSRKAREQAQRTALEVMEALADPDAPGYEVAPGLVLEHPARELARDRDWLLSRRSMYYKTKNRRIENMLRKFGEAMEYSKKAGRPFETWEIPQPPAPTSKPTKATKEQFAAFLAALHS